MKESGRLVAIRVGLVVGALLAFAIGIDQHRAPLFGRPGWLVPVAIGGSLFCLAARAPVGLPFRLGKPILLGAIPGLLIVNSMFAYEGIHVMPTDLHFGPIFGWTLYAEAMMALAVLVGVALASGFTERSRD